MSRKIIVFLIFPLFLSFFVGGFFLFLKTPKINSLLASMVGIKNGSDLERELFVLKEKISFLENKLAERESELEHLDDLAESVDELGQRVIELEEEVKETKVILALATTENEKEKIEREEEENKKEDKNKENEERTEQVLCEINPLLIPQRDKIVFNEIAWMGTQVSGNDEWIELKNLSSEPINLSGWQILDKNQDIKIFFDEEDIIPPFGFYLLERSNDQTVPTIKADKIYTGNLSNENEQLYLFDNNCQLRDKIVSPWPAGDNNSKRTMERNSLSIVPAATTQDLSWQTSYQPGGTPKAENSKGYVIVVSGETKESSRGGGGAPPPPREPEPQPALVVINEIMYDLEGKDEGREWIEILNIDQKTADLTGWTFYEDETNHRITLVSGAEIISPGDFAVIASDSNKFLEDYPDFSGNLFDSSFSLSNTGETIALKAGNKLIDEVSYDSLWGAGGDGNSLQRVSSQENSNNSQNWQPGLPTPGQENQFSLDQDQEQKEQEKQQEPEQEETEDTIPPQIVFDILPLQTQLSFMISFKIQDFATGVATPVLDGFIFRWKEESEDWQEDEYQEIEGDINTFNGKRQFEGENGKTYYFQIKAKDRSGNESEWLPEPPAFTKIEIEQPQKKGCTEKQININTASEQETRAG